MNPEIMSFQYATGMCLLLENVRASEQNRSVANVQSDVLCPSRMHAATHTHFEAKTKSKMAAGRHFEKRKIAITRPPFELLPPNLAWW